MKLTAQQFDKIKFCFLKEKQNSRTTNHQALNAILYITIHRCKWSRLPEHFGDWKSIYNRMNKWVKNNTLETVFAQLQHDGIIRVKGYPILYKHDLSAKKKKPIALPSKSHQQAGTRFDPNNQPRLIWLPSLLEKKIEKRNRLQNDH